MAFIIEVSNPFEPWKNLKKSQHPGGVTIREWLQLEYPGFVEFPIPTICAVNGKAKKRAEWDEVIQPDDVVNFIAMPEGPFIIIALIILIVAIALTLALAPDIPKPGSLPSSDPVFSNRGQNNDIRLGEPIEVCYGRNRIYPSFASRPYYQYINNDQFQHSLFCLGQGEFDIEAIKIGDAPIGDYQEVTYEFIPPGGTVTLFPTSVETSVEVGGQTLYGPNESSYPVDGWVGPFPANSAGTLTELLEIDVVFPKGLYSVNKKGNITNISVSFQWQAREINDLGAAVGGWADLLVTTVTAATTTPQRRTFSAAVSVGRYEARLRRTNGTDLSSKAGNDIVWEGMRAFVNVEQNFGNVTLFAVRIRASNNLNDRTALKFNVIATRKLPVLGTDGWSEPVPTRSIVWAFADVFRSVYGGRMDDIYIDLETLETLDSFYEGRDEHFDWIFRDAITVWEAAKTIALAGRGIPLLQGSRVTLKRDGPLSVPVTMFSPENIVKGTFEWAVKLFDPDEYDSIRAEYTEQSTGYKQEQVLCTLPGGTTDHPQDLRLYGIQDRAHAYHQGLFMLASVRYVREQITFETGMEGHIPSYGDLVIVSHDMPRWGQAGYVLDAQIQTDIYILWLSEPLDWGDTGEYQIALRGKKGEILGPFAAQPGDDPKKVEIDIISGTIDFLLTGETEPMLFIFGPVGNLTKDAKIVKVEPGSGENVKITAVNYESILHSFDELIPPPLDQTGLPPVPPDLPVISHLYVTQIDDVQHVVQIAWTAAFGARYYLVQTSEDDENWTDRGTTNQTALLLQVRPGALYVRVSAVNTGQGPWIEAAITIGIVSGLTELIPWVALEWKVDWFSAPGAIGYTGKVYDNSDPMTPVLKRTVSLAIDQSVYDYDYALAVVDSNLTREMKLTVDAEFTDGPGGAPTEIALHNSIPVPPSFLGSEFQEETTDGYAVWRLSWDLPHEDDLIRVKVWVSDDPDFDPSLTVPVANVAAGSPGWAGLIDHFDAEILLDTNGEHTERYWRVGVFDVWENEISSNVTDVQTIPAYP